MSPKRKIKLLVVDDEKDICRFEKSFFERRNFNTYTAQDPTKAISQARKVNPDIAIIDIHMGKRNGTDVLKKLLKVSPQCKCLMVTWDKEQALQAKKIGAIDFLIKPIEVKDLGEAVNRIIKKPKKLGA